MVNDQDYQAWSLKLPIKCKHINKRPSSQFQFPDSAEGRRSLQKKASYCNSEGFAKRFFLPCLTSCACSFKSKFFQLFHSMREERKGETNKLNLFLE